MGIVGNIVGRLGPVLRPFHAGEEKLASRVLCEEDAATIEVTSDAFADGAPLPRRYAQEGDDVSPPLRWANLPPGTREVVVLCEDPDAPLPHPFAHWVVYGLAPATTALPENVDNVAAPREGRMRQGLNGARKVGYFGAAPPLRHGVHSYHFQVFALDTPLHFDEIPSRVDVVEAMGHHVLAYGDLVATYERA